MSKPIQLDADFVRQISSIMMELTGVQFFDKQSGMIQSRLFKRMLELDIKDPEAYLKYLKEHYQTESQILVSLLTTHHTFFFREFFHFDFLAKEGLAKIISQLRLNNQNKIRIWCAACSQGQEVYSLAMFLDYHLARMAPDISFEILGTDIDIDCIKVAKNGVYRFEQIKEIPTVYQGDHWQKGTEEISQYVRIKDYLRKNCQFVTSNLFDMSLLMGQSFHLIFCRNVFIYFNQTQINTVSKTLFQLLVPQGYLFLGLSESLSGTPIKVDQVGPSIYLKSTESTSAQKNETQDETSAHQSAPVLQAPRKVRVVCVDDSPVILTLLKKVLASEHHFDVVATASNGVEAHDVISKYKPDIVTLDIHMPQMSGLDYLKKHFSETHPPVVMVSSVSREDAQYGLQSLEKGAIDFIEKPTLASLQDKSEQIRMKLRCALEYHATKKEAHLDLIKKFKTDFSSLSASGLVRLCVGSLGDLQKIRTLLEEGGKEFPAFVILLHGAEAFIPLLCQNPISGHLFAHKLEEDVPLESNKIYLGSFEQMDVVEKMLSIKTPCHVFFLGEPPPTAVARLSKVPQASIFLEESPLLDSKSSYQMMKRLAVEVIPYSSLVYQSAKRLLSHRTNKVA